MNVIFNNSFGTMKLEEKVRSIFDTNIAGQIAIDGNYYCIHHDHKTHELYALTKEAEIETDQMGYRLTKDGETAVFNGEKVRAMTFKEEQAYNEDNLLMAVDLWGNVAEDSDEFDFEWYLANCI